MSTHKFKWWRGDALAATYKAHMLGQQDLAPCAAVALLQHNSAWPLAVDGGRMAAHTGTSAANCGAARLACAYRYSPPPPMLCPVSTTRVGSPPCSLITTSSSLSTFSKLLGTQPRSAKVACAPPQVLHGKMPMNGNAAAKVRLLSSKCGKDCRFITLKGPSPPPCKKINTGRSPGVVERGRNS